MSNSTPLNLLHHQKTLAKKNQSLLILHSQFDTLSHNHTHLLSQHQDLENRMGMITGQLAELKGQNEQLERYKNQSRIETSVLDSQKVDYQVLEAEKEVLQRVNKQLQDALHEQERKMELKQKHKLRMEQMHYENQIEALKVKQSERDIQIQLQEEEMRHLQSELDKLSEECRGLESKVSEKRQRKDEALKEVLSVQNATAQEEQQLNKLHHDIIDRDNAIATLTLQVLQLQYENKNQEALLRHSETQLREQKIRNQLERQMMTKRAEYLKRIQELEI